ncbi:hypothetical protein OS242_07870 [Tumebacillus sp. DT12]|uniref:Uncharacterized protein n=1 Tax=Tumebacillus lacus TaxID=2995335 RepID=A0ABT3WYX2_9BACL|nr:hypothetical protein [Tumebacillus lacus]MCX7569879.1 hypothetical protein [Tumebacillus lacus]
MTNEALLVQVGRIIGETVQASEARIMKKITDEVTGLRTEMYDMNGQLAIRLDRVEEQLEQVQVELKAVKVSVVQLTDRVGGLERTMRRVENETEKMALEIAATM